MMSRIIYCLVACAILSSCAGLRRYKPVTEVDSNLFGREVTITDTTTIASISWREFFTDTHLQALIDTAMLRNSDLRAAQLRIKEAETTLRTARLAYLPSFNFTPNGAVSSFDSSPAQWVYNVPIAASWEIDIFGRLTAQKRQAKALVEQSRDYEQAVKSGLVATLATQYYTLLSLDEQLRIVKATAERFEESVRVMRAMKQAGMANETAVAQIEAAYNATSASSADIELAINNLENAICRILGQTPQPIKRGKLSDYALPATLSVGIPVQILANRPDVRAAEQALAQAFYATNIARTSLYPSLTLSGSAGWTNNLGSMVTNPGKVLLSAAGSLLQPIFNARALRGQVEIAKARQEQAAIQFEQSVINAGAEVNDALAKYDAASKKQQWRKSQLESLQRAAKHTELMMKHSSTTYLEVLTAEQSLLQGELDNTNDRYQTIEAIIELYHALGGF